MWLLETSHVPASVFARSRNATDPESVEYLQQHSSHVYAVGVGRELRFVFGTLSPSFLSAELWLWMAWMVEVTFTRGELRLLRRALRAMVAQWGDRPRMEILGERDARFARFLGFEFEQSIDGRQVYRWAV